MISNIILFAFVLPSIVVSFESFQVEKRQDCESTGCAECCSYDSPLNCYQHVNGPEAGQYYCATHPEGQLVGSFAFDSSSAVAASTSTPRYYQSASVAIPPPSPSGGITCDIGQEVCGTGCMWSFNTCCPSGQGSCDAGETCVTASDGTEGCCPVGDTCVGSGSEYSASSTTALRPSSTAASSGYDSSTTRYAGGPAKTLSQYTVEPTGGLGGASYTSSSVTAASSYPAIQSVGSAAAINGMGSARFLHMILGVVGVLFGF